MANDKAWDRRTSDWVATQEKSRKIKEEAERLGLHGEQRRKYITERRKEVAARTGTS